MGLFNMIKNQLIDIIEWPDAEPGVLVHRFERHDNEIKYGAKLIVRPGQRAVFVNEGKIADAFEPGTYTLETKNLPILRTLLSWSYGFESPFKAEVYFIKTTEQLDRKWGTTSPVMMRDNDFGIVRIRARGNYAYKIGITEDMISRFVGARDEFTSDDIEGQLRTKIISSFSDCIGEAKIPALDLAAQYDEISELMRQKMTQVFADLGLDIITFALENISLPEEVERAMDQRASMGAIGNLNNFSQYQAANALRDAANNDGNAGNLMGMMIGGQFGAGMGDVLTQNKEQPQQSSAAPPPLPTEKSYFAALNGQQAGPFKMAELKMKVQAGEVTKETLVWSEGMDNWIKAGEVAELNSLFAGTPPPLPPM